MDKYIYICIKINNIIMPTLAIYVSIQSEYNISTNKKNYAYLLNIQYLSK